jgi:hypothetical protein
MCNKRATDKENIKIKSYYSEKVQYVTNITEYENYEGSKN